MGLGSEVRAGVEGRARSFGHRISPSPHLSTVLPQRPHDLRLVSTQPTELEVAWTPGLSGIYPLTHCILQVGETAAFPRLHLSPPSTQSRKPSSSPWETSLSQPFV